MITLTFNVAGVQEFKAGIERFSEGISDLTPAWEDIRDYFWEVEAGQFDAEGGGDSGPWAPLSPTYAAWKAVHYGTPILELTGALRESLTGGGGSEVEISPMRLRVGSAVPYGIFHQWGTDRMAQRKVIDLTHENHMAMMKAVQRHMLIVSERAGIPWDSN